MDINLLGPWPGINVVGSHMADHDGESIIRGRDDDGQADRSH